MKSRALPLVGVICDKEIIGPHPFHLAGDKYLQALISGSDCLPILIPALAQPQYIEQLLSTIDGLLLTGGYSMVNPLYYQDDAADTSTKLDINRDGTSLPLAKAAVEAGIPLLGICRGFQEINVAFGGSLHQYLHEAGQFIEHRENKGVALEEQYRDSHSVELAKDGKLANITGQTNIRVNSLHTQGVDRLADDLAIEAVAEDGLVEAFSVKTASTFAMAVQWHPEWQVEKHINNLKLFQAFGAACRERQTTK